MAKVNLYVKCHIDTNLQYFGKTTRTNTNRYKGSGVRWSNHIKKHGYKVKTIIVGIYEEDDPMLIDHALGFSAANNIVGSEKWANLIEENGINGGGKNNVGKASVKDKDGNTFSVYKDDPRILTGELVGNTKGKKFLKIKCEYCHKEIGIPHIKRHIKAYHLDLV